MHSGAHQVVVIRRDFKASPAMLDAEVKGSSVVVRLYHHMFKATQDAGFYLTTNLFYDIHLHINVVSPITTQKVAYVGSS